MSKRFDVIALGELLIDFTENGMSENGNPILEANPGGAPCNVLAMLQKLEKKTAFIGKVGKDSFGDMLENVLFTIGIHTSNLLRDEKVPTTLAFVHTAPDGDRSFSFYRNPGADVMLRKEDIDFSLIEQSRIFHFGTLSMTDPELAETTKEAVRFAKEKGLLISFDPNLRPLLWDDMKKAKEMMQYGMENCDVLKISDDEICFFTEQDNVETGLKMITAQYQPKLICGTMGKNGSIAIHKNQWVTCAPFLNKHTVETTGAGDTFMACILNFLLENDIQMLEAQQLKDMLSFANAAASIITTRRGALKVMPEKEEVINLMNGYHS